MSDSGGPAAGEGFTNFYLRPRLLHRYSLLRLAIWLAFAVGLGVRNDALPEVLGTWSVGVAGYLLLKSRQVVEFSIHGIRVRNLLRNQYLGWGYLARAEAVVLSSWLNRALGLRLVLLDGSMVYADAVGGPFIDWQGSREAALDLVSLADSVGVWREQFRASGVVNIVRDELPPISDALQEWYRAGQELEAEREAVRDAFFAAHPGLRSRGQGSKRGRERLTAADEQRLAEELRVAEERIDAIDARLQQHELFIRGRFLELRPRFGYVVAVVGFVAAATASVTMAAVMWQAAHSGEAWTGWATISLGLALATVAMARLRQQLSPRFALGEKVV